MSHLRHGIVRRGCANFGSFRSFDETKEHAVVQLAAAREVAARRPPRNKRTDPQSKVMRCRLMIGRLVPLPPDRLEPFRLI